MVIVEVALCPADGARAVPGPRSVVPSKNSTAPVGTPPEPVTVAVKVTLWPKTDGVSLDATSVAVWNRAASVRMPLEPWKAS